MKRYFNLSVYYKYNKEDGFYKEYFQNINENTLNRIKERFEKEYENGDYVALRFEYDLIQ